MLTYPQAHDDENDDTNILPPQTSCQGAACCLESYRLQETASNNQRIAIVGVEVSHSLL